jgi:SulP family sulfate permease
MNTKALAAYRRIGAKLSGSHTDAMIAGVFVGILSLLYYLSYASLIFSGSLAPWLAYGLSATFITGAIGGLLTSLRSSLPFAIGGPDGSTTAVVAALIGTLASRLVAIGAEAHLLVMTLAVLASSAALTGLFLYGLGSAQLGRAIRFIPFPVIGGFLGASGCLMLVGAAKVLTGYNPNVVNLGHFLEAGSVAKLLAGVLTAVFLIVGRKYWNTPVALPLQLLATMIVFHAALFVFGISLSDAQDQGWMFVVFSERAFTPMWSLELSGLPWSVLPGLSAEFVAVTFVAAISLLLNLTSIEMATKQEAGLDHELKVQGGINILCAALGGYVSCITITRSKLNYVLGKTSRLSGLVVAAISAASIFVNPEVLGYIPKCVLGGLLITIGYDITNRWLISAAGKLEQLEYLSLLAIALIILWWGFLPGVAIGVIFGCATFALSAGRISVIKFSFDGTEYRSSLDRGPRELAILSAHGGAIQGLRLQSYLFFGSANRLYEHVKALLTQRFECRFLVFDFRLVTGIDSAAVHSFTQIKRVADALGARLVLVNLTPAIEKAFKDNQFITDDILLIQEIDHALEFCESELIATYGDAGSTSRSLNEWLGEALGSSEHGDKLAAYCHRCEFAAGDILAQQGAPSDSMHFIVDGRVGIIVPLEGGRSIRVRSLGPHTTIGEMGLMTGRNRTATVQAETASVAYELRLEAFEELKSKHPELIQLLLTYVIGVMAERLGFASRVIGALQR